MKGCKLGSRGILGTAVVLAGLLTLPAVGQQPTNVRGFNERAAEKKANPEDKTGIWMLDFHFKDPRIITVDVPGQGRKLVWYLWYQVSNGTGEARVFRPDFTWVTHDEGTVHHDQVIPKAQLAVQRIEDPTNLLQIKNSISIMEEPIPLSREFDEKGQRIAYPKVVTGVATWSDINPKADRFSIFIYGLSDGWSAIDGPDGKPIVRRKTLQLKFKRLGDEFQQHSGEIRYVGHEWVYTTVDTPTPPSELKKEERKPEPAKPAAPGQNAGRR